MADSKEFPQALADACAVALDATPGRPILLLPRVVSVRGRVCRGSDRVESVWFLEADLGGETLAGMICHELAPDEAERWLRDHQPVLIVNETIIVEPMGHVMHGSIALPRKGIEAESFIADIQGLLSQFVDTATSEPHRLYLH